MKYFRLMKRVVILFLVLAAGCVFDGVQGEYVSIYDIGSYYYVTIDYTKGGTPREIGAEYITLINQIFPEFEENLDAYLSDFDEYASQGIMSSYDDMLAKSFIIRQKVDGRYIEELEGMGEKVSGTVDIAGDGKISKNELYILSLMPDVARPYSCSGISFFGKAAKKRRTVTGRNLDWLNGITGSLNSQHSVTTIKAGNKSICLVGFLGSLSVVSAFNDDGVFASILDSTVGAPPIDVNGKNSYVMDLRYALENFRNKEDVAEYMTDSSRDYTYNHNILLSDRSGSKVVENSLFTERGLRSWNSALNPGIEWGYKDSICVVNSFVLAGNPDNHTVDASNAARWINFYNLTGAIKGKKDLNDVQNIMSYNQGHFSGHIWRSEEFEAAVPGLGTVQQIIFVPETLELKIHFRPPEAPNDVPLFEKVFVSF